MLRSEKGEADVYQIGVKGQQIHNRAYNILVKTIQSPHLHLIVSRGMELLLYNSEKKEIIKEAHLPFGTIITKIAYSSKQKLIFLLSQTQQLHVFSYDLIRLNQKKDRDKKIVIRQIRHCIDFAFIDSISAFLILAPDRIEFLYVEIFSNHARSLFQNAYKFMIKELGVRVLANSYFVNFGRQILHNSKNYFMAYNSNQLKLTYYNINWPLQASQRQLQHGTDSTGKQDLLLLPSRFQKKSVIRIKNICEGSQQISNIFYSSSLHLIIVGSIYGIIRVYRVNFGNITATSSTQQQVIQMSGSNFAFKLSLHSEKRVHTISMYSPTLIVSVGEDESLEVISLDQMNCIEKFSLPSGLSQTTFVSNNLFIGVLQVGFDKILYQYNVCLEYELKMQHHSTIMQSLFSDNIILFILTDNSLNFIIKYEDKEVMKQTFMPPRCKTIVSAEIYPYGAQKQYWLLTDESQVYKYVLKEDEDHNISIEIRQVVELNSFKDIHNHETHEKVVLMKFISIVPIYYDSDIQSKTSQPNYNKVSQVQPIMFGCETGQILICSSLAVNQIISRVRYFDEPVHQLHSCAVIQENKISAEYQSESRCIFLASKHQIVIFLIKNYDVPKILYKITISQNYFLKTLKDSYIGLVIQKLPIIIFPDGNNVRFWMSQSDLHLSNISYLECFSENKLISGDQTGNILVWTLFDQILIRVHASQSILIECCYFHHNKLLYGYQGKIFQIRQQIKLQNNFKKSNNGQLNLTQNQNWKVNHTFILKADNSGKKFTQIFNIKTNNAKIINHHTLHLKTTRSKNIHDIEGYVDKMKKSLTRLNTLTKSKPIDNEQRLGEQEEMQKSFVMEKQEKKLGIKKKFDQSRVQSNKKIDLSLPKISGHLAYEEEVGEFTSRKGKNRNKKYQFLFHFPNKGLYSQLVSKNMLY